MPIIRCTEKLLKELKVRPSEEWPQNGYIGGWHANLLRIERRKCVIVTNDQTLYTLFIPALKKPEFERFGEIFGQHLFKNLCCEGFAQHQIERVLADNQEITIAKTNNRSVLGSMNDVAYQIEHRVRTLDGLDRLDLEAFNQELNRIPMGAINYKFSIEALKSKLEEIDT